MYPVHCMRKFVCDRLTLAAQEILGAFEKRVEDYEAEIARQRRLLETVFSAEPKFQKIDYDCFIKEDRSALSQQSSGLRSGEVRRIKEEQDEVHITEKQARQVEVLPPAISKPAPPPAADYSKGQPRFPGPAPSQNKSDTSSQTVSSAPVDQTLAVPAASSFSPSNDEPDCEDYFRVSDGCESPWSDIEAVSVNLDTPAAEKTPERSGPSTTEEKTTDHGKTDKRGGDTTHDNTRLMQLQERDRETKTSTTSLTLPTLLRSPVLCDISKAAPSDSHLTEIQDVSHVLGSSVEMLVNEHDKIPTFPSFIDQTSHKLIHHDSHALNPILAEKSQDGGEEEEVSFDEGTMTFIELTSNGRSIERAFTESVEPLQKVDLSTTATQTKREDPLATTTGHPTTGGKSRSRKASPAGSKQTKPDSAQNLVPSEFVQPWFSSSEETSAESFAAYQRLYNARMASAETAEQTPFMKFQQVTAMSGADEGNFPELSTISEDLELTLAGSSGAAVFSAASDWGVTPSTSNEVPTCETPRKKSASTKSKKGTATKRQKGGWPESKRKKPKKGRAAKSDAERETQPSPDGTKSNANSDWGGSSDENEEKVENPFKCDICGKVKSNFKNYKFHMKSHTVEKTHKCEICGIMFRETWDLNKHLIIHSVEKPFGCQICGKGFNRRYNLDLHLRVHTGEKPHQCSTCGKSFSTLVNMKKHQRIHTGEKPYTCSHCSKDFADSSAFKNHLRIHTGEKPFNCPFCSRQFATRTTLKRHTRTHTGEKPYDCQVCGKKFAHKSDLTGHTRLHTGEKPYTCGICGKQFNTWLKLNKHKEEHPGENPEPQEDSNHMNLNQM